MQAPGILNLTIHQGASWDLTMTWKVGDPPAVVNLTGYTARMQVREKVTSPGTMTSLTTSNGKITLGGAQGTVVLALSATDTGALRPGNYVYDLELVSSSGYVTRLVEGKVRVTPEVTR
jgi:hypothetical protein